MQVPHPARSGPHADHIRLRSRQGHRLPPFPLAVLVSLSAVGVGVAIAALPAPLPGAGDQVHLWYGIPIVEMLHPGHDPMVIEGLGISFEVRGTIGPPQGGG